ncbi:MAG: rhodanese-like domain-containing protein [Clostridia bacterium]
MKGTSIFAAIALTTLLLAGCGASQPESKPISAEEVAKNEKGYKDIDQAQAKALIEKKSVQIVDVRTPEEFAEGHIEGAQLIPLQELEGRLKELKTDQAYLIVCRSGNRSAQASELLAKNGFTTIYNMTGGMNEWQGDVSK